MSITNSSKNYFKELPLELKRMVWSYTLESQLHLLSPVELPSCTDLTEPDNPLDDSNEDLGWVLVSKGTGTIWDTDLRSIPSLLHVSREWRQEGLRLYTCLSTFVGPQEGQYEELRLDFDEIPQTSNMLYFNAEIDSIFVNTVYKQHRTDGPGTNVYHGLLVSGLGKAISEGAVKKLVLGTGTLKEAGYFGNNIIEGEWSLDATIEKLRQAEDLKDLKELCVCTAHSCATMPRPGQRQLRVVDIHRLAKENKICPRFSQDWQLLYTGLERASQKPTESALKLKVWTGSLLHHPLEFDQMFDNGLSQFHYDFDYAEVEAIYEPAVLGYPWLDSIEKDWLGRYLTKESQDTEDDGS